MHDRYLPSDLERTRRAIAIAKAMSQAGIGVVELLVAITLGIGLTMSAAALFISCRATYLMHDDSMRLHDNARVAIDVIGRALSQASFDHPADPMSDSAMTIHGLDNRSLKSTSPVMQNPVAKAINGSDVLAVHFAGAGEGPEGDGTVNNCAGFSVGRTAQGGAAEDRGWSIFYVATNHTGEPELYCKYRGRHAWATVAIARGVESFQVLYGVADDRNFLPTRFMNASQIDQLDSAMSLTGSTTDESTAEKNRQSNWKKITQVKIAVVMRGAAPLRVDLPVQSWALFGDEYREDAADPGVRFDEAAVPHGTRNRLRKLFRAQFRFHQAALAPAT